MKKSLKLVAIFISVILVTVIGGLSIYFVLQNNKTYYIYDLRLVEPLNNVDGYIYHDTEVNYNSVKNKNVYLFSEQKNSFPIGVYVNTSDNSANITFKSTNPEVANVVVEDKSCKVNYYKPGTATISVSIGSVTDSFDVNVYEEIPNEFNVFDDRYFGEYSRVFPNVLYAYSDDNEYTYRYTAKTLGFDDDEINNDNLRLAHVNSNLISKAVLEVVETSPNVYEKVLKITCKSDIKVDTKTTFVVQSYVVDDGEVKVLSEKDVEVELNIIALNRPKFIQAVVSTTPDFNEKSVFVSTIKTDISDLSDEQIRQGLNVEGKVKQYFDNKQTETILASKSENPFYNVYFKNNADKILYVKFRLVYANGKVEYLNETNLTIDSTINYESKNKGDYYEFTFTGTSNLNCTVTSNEYDDIGHTFNFEYVVLDRIDNWDKFYKRENGKFIYTYFDPAFHFSEICDASGNVIGFTEFDVNGSGK